ncbi:hypothetical protein CCACVL1_07284, partial [Corchorus capsularis]
ILPFSKPLLPLSPPPFSLALLPHSISPLLNDLNPKPEALFASSQKFCCIRRI